MNDKLQSLQENITKLEQQAAHLAQLCMHELRDDRAYHPH